VPRRRGRRRDRAIWLADATHARRPALFPLGVRVNSGEHVAAHRPEQPDIRSPDLHAALREVFSKLGVTSRNQLLGVLPDIGDVSQVV
jgi:hypothetical protein